MTTLKQLDAFKQFVIGYALQVDHEIENVQDYDMDLLYPILRSRPLLALTNIITKKVTGLGIPHAESVSLDTFFSETSILTGESFPDIRKRIYEDLSSSPFSKVNTQGHRKQSANNTDHPPFYEMDATEEDMLEFVLSTRTQALYKSGGVFLTPVAYREHHHEEYHFCTSHLDFLPKTEIYLEGNIAQTGYINEVRHILEYFTNTGIAFAVSGNNPSISENKHIIGGLNKQDAYRINPETSNDLEERVWLSAAAKMLPKY